jgi:serine protease Do
MTRSKFNSNLIRLFLSVSLLLASVLACNMLADTTEEPPTPTVASTSVVVNVPTTPPTTVPPTEDTRVPPIGSETSDLATAVVQIYAYTSDYGEWEPLWSGSGSIVSPDGFILTNAHVVDPEDYQTITYAIGLTDRTDQPPEFEYLAEVVVVDYVLDLAVIKIVSDMDGNSVSVSLPYIALGDSDEIDIGTDLRILGFPGIGGDTITFTEGAVSGFTQERGIEGRAWIKTDATIAGGNSGGMAANDSGQLIAVPTSASAGVEEFVDCRPVVDTNRDGYIDWDDDCVPIGGFINGLRPINLAKPLIEAALTTEVYSPGTTVEQFPEGEVDISEVTFYNLIFADGVTEDDIPTQQWYAMPSGSQSICAFWDYEGMVNGMIWSAMWFTNGEIDKTRSILENTWQGGSEGNWWVCMSNEYGLQDGTYELILEVEGEMMISEAIFVGSDREVVDFTIINESSITICFVQISPMTASGWGPDELGQTEVIEPGYERAFTIATGYYDLRLSDCDGELIYEEYELEVFEDYPFALIDSE